jgi:calcium/calmodulin-dependent protein kinase I
MGGCVSAQKNENDSNTSKTTTSPAPKPTTPREVQKTSQDNNKKSDHHAHDEELETVNNEPIENLYDLGKEIGKGGFSVVVEGTHKKSQEKFAIKCIKKTMVEGDDIKLLKREIHIMKKKVNHPNVLKLFEVYENDEEFFLVMELVSGKELFDKIVEKGQYSEAGASNIVRQIVSAVDYLHQNGIAHRDLKPENLLSAEVDGHEIIKIADFGFSKNFGEEKLMTSCGSPGYVAPEVLTCESYDMSVDLWSIGVIIYILLCGYPPFYADNAPALFKKIMEVNYDFDDPSWNDVSEAAKNLIRHLLVKDPKKRYTANQCLQDPWVQGTGVSEKVLKLKELKDYQSVRKLNIQNDG